MMKTVSFPLTVSDEGVSATIRKFSSIKNGKTYTTFSAEYFLLGKRKQEWRSRFEDAKNVALEACRTISRGQQVSLQLANGVCGRGPANTAWLTVIQETRGVHRKGDSTTWGLPFGT
jgi:hypothetical protein